MKGALALLIGILLMLSTGALVLAADAEDPFSSGPSSSGQSIPQDVFESVGSQSGGFSDGVFGFIEDGFLAVFNFLLDPDLNGGDITSTEVLWIKIFLWVGLFALLTSLFKMTFLRGRVSPRAANILAFVIATISVRFLPATVVAIVASAYSGVLSAILLLVPIYALHRLLGTYFPLRNGDKGDKVRAFAHVLIWITTAGFFWYIYTADINEFFDRFVRPVAALGVLLAIIGAIINGVQAIGGGGSQNSFPHSPSGSGGFGDAVRNLFGGGGKNKPIKNYKDAHEQINELHKELDDIKGSLQDVNNELHDGEFDREQITQKLNTLRDLRDQQKAIDANIAKLHQRLRELA